jgi:hypothetical protein
MVEPVTATIREAMSRKTSKNHTLPVRLSARGLVRQARNGWQPKLTC